jgi:hypothetical protein
MGDADARRDTGKSQEVTLRKREGARTAGQSESDEKF